MTKFSFTLALVLATLTSSAHAITFEVVGKTPFSLIKQTRTVDLNKTVGAITVEVLRESLGKQIQSFNGSESSILEIAGLGNHLEVISDSKMRAYGWCYSVNGKAPELMPDRVTLKAQTDHLRWYYGYALYDKGEWQAQCVPVV